MKFQKDAGYGHTLDLGNGHHVAHDPETGEHHLINHASRSMEDGHVSTHKTADAAIKAGRGLNGDRSGNAGHPEVKKYKAATEVKKSELFKAEEDAIVEFMSKAEHEDVENMDRRYKTKMVHHSKLSHDQKKQVERMYPHQTPVSEHVGHNAPIGNHHYHYQVDQRGNVSGHRHLTQKGHHEGRLENLRAMKKPRLTKAENPDEKDDAALGEEVEHLVEEHHDKEKARGAEVDERGHDIFKAEKDAINAFMKKSSGMPKHVESLVNDHYSNDQFDKPGATHVPDFDPHNVKPEKNSYDKNKKAAFRTPPVKPVKPK